jgi:hypothetical protein
MEAEMSEITKAVTAEQAVDWVFKRLEVSREPARTLSDWLTDAGLFNPYQRALAQRLLRAELRPPHGRHAHLTVEKRWAYERERWAKEAGLSKGKAQVEFSPETDTTHALIEAMDGNEHLPETAREAVSTISRMLAVRANRKLDETSAQFIGEGVQELMHEMEVQGRLMEEKEARIKQAERHAEDLRRTNDRLLAIMEQLTGKSVADGALAPTDQREDKDSDKGGGRPRTN